MRCMEKAQLQFYGIVDYRDEGKGRGEQVELLGLILINIMSDKISTSLKGKEHIRVSQTIVGHYSISIPFPNFRYL